MLSLILGIIAFGLYFLYDINSFTGKSRIFHSFFLIGSLLIAAATALDLYKSHIQGQCNIFYASFQPMKHFFNNDFLSVITFWKKLQTTVDKCGANLYNIYIYVYSCHERRHFHGVFKMRRKSQ